jgi:hypothetical protein
MAAARGFWHGGTERRLDQPRTIPLILLVGGGLGQCSQVAPLDGGTFEAGPDFGAQAICARVVYRRSPG